MKNEPEITYGVVDSTEYLELDYTAIATPNERSDLENKAIETFVHDRRREPDLIRITDIKELGVFEHKIYYALAIAFLRK